MKRKNKTIALKKQTISNLRNSLQKLRGGTGPAPADNGISKNVCSPFCGPSMLSICDYGCPETNEQQ